MTKPPKQDWFDVPDREHPASIDLRPSGRRHWLTRLTDASVLIAGLSLLLGLVIPKLWDPEPDHAFFLGEWNQIELDERVLKVSSPGGGKRAAFVVRALTVTPEDPTFGTGGSEVGLRASGDDRQPWWGTGLVTHGSAPITFSLFLERHPDLPGKEWRVRVAMEYVTPGSGSGRSVFVNREESLEEIVTIRPLTKREETLVGWKRLPIWIGLGLFLVHGILALTCAGAGIPTIWSDEDRSEAS